MVIFLSACYRRSVELREIGELCLLNLWGIEKCFILASEMAFDIMEKRAKCIFILSHLGFWGMDGVF